MPENATETVDNTTAQTPKIASVGKMERVTMTFQQDGATNDKSDENTNLKDEGANAIKDATQTAVAGKAAAAPTFTDEALAAFFKEKGIDYEGIDKLKEKLTAPAQTAAADTPEQIQAKALAKEKKIVDKFVADGGTIEQFVALKNIANADLAEFSKNTLKAELKTAGFTDEQADQIIKDRYYQIDDEELEQLDDESEKAFKKRSKEYFANKLANRSQHIQKQMQDVLKGLNTVIDSEDLQAQKEVAFSAKIDEDFKTLPRKLSIEIGEIGGKTVSPVDYDVSETDIAEVKAILKDPAQRQQLLFNEDGSLNITRITQALLKEKAFDSASKVSFHSGMTKAIADFQTVFPARSAQELGVGGNQQRPNGQKGSAASFGKTERVKTQPQNA